MTAPLTPEELDAMWAHAEADRQDFNGSAPSIVRQAANTLRLLDEHAALRVQCDGCADAETRTGRAHYADCPVGVLQDEVAALRERHERALALIDDHVRAWEALSPERRGAAHVLRVVAAILRGES